MTPWIDYLIFCPKEVEYKAISAALACKDPDRLSGHPQEGWADYNIISSLTEEPIRVRIVKLDQQGVLNAGIAVQQYLLEGGWWPKTVVSFGIAGTLNEEKVEVGDVVAPERVYYYEPARESENPLVSGETQFTPQQPIFETQINSKRYIKPEEMKVVENLASGEKVGAARWGVLRTLAALSHRNVWVIEMEAAGVGAAVKQRKKEIEGGYDFIVVKGISDSVNSSTKPPDPQNKSSEIANKQFEKERQRAAATKAAKALVCLIRHSRGPIRQAVEISDYGRIVEGVLKITPTDLVGPVTRRELHRVVWPAKSPPAKSPPAKSPPLEVLSRFPPVFYHWMANNSGLHWVDFCHLLVLRAYRKAGFPVYALISDNIDNFTETLRVRQDSVIKRILYDGTVAWKSRERSRQQEINTYVCSRAGDGSDSSIQRISSQHENHWIPYICWQSAASNRCIVFVWRAREYIYEELNDILGLHTLLIKGPDFLIGGKVAKFRSSAKDVTINNVDGYKSLHTWLETSKTCEEQELFNYLYKATSTVVENGDNSIEDWSSMMHFWNSKIFCNGTE